MVCGACRLALAAVIVSQLLGGALAGQEALGISMPEVVPLVAARAKPSWAVEAVPDAVWLLTDAATMADDSDEAKLLLEAAEEQARVAVAAEDGVATRFALAVVLGMRANREGGGTRVKKASELHVELTHILEVEPEHAGARHLIGRLYAGIRRMNRVTRWIATRLLGGSVLKQATWALAEQNLLFAEQHASDISDHHLQLANLYRDTDRPGLALAEVEHVLALPPQSLAEEEVQDEALELRQRLGR